MACVFVQTHLDWNKYCASCGSRNLECLETRINSFYEKTNKDGSSSTKTTKRIGKGRIKGAIKNARLARLDRVATRQATKAADKKSKGTGKFSGLGK